MEDRENLQRLDELVAKLLNAYNDLQEENKKLGNELQARHLDIVQLEEKISLLQDEKTHVHKRVAGIIGLVEQWESSCAERSEAVDEHDVVPEEVRKKELESSSQLFSMG